MNSKNNIAVTLIICLFTIVFSFSDAPITSAIADENGELPKFEVIADKAKSFGIRTGSDLIQDAVVHDSPYSFFHNSSEKVISFANDVLILVNHPEQIKSQTDLENYVHAQRDFHHYIGQLFYGFGNNSMLQFGMVLKPLKFLKSCFQW